MGSASLPVYALIDYEDPYVQPLILSALKARLPAELLIHIQSLDHLPNFNDRLLQWRQYESIDLEQAAEQSSSSLINSYIIRKALIRKHYLSTTVSNWLVKHPESKLSKHVKPSVDFELDYAEFLDDALVEAFELRESFDRNENLEPAERQWWILKPGMSDRGQGIRLFSTEDELVAIFEQWEEDLPDSDDEAEHSGDEMIGVSADSTKATAQSTGIITSQLRHFVAQPYVHPPLLFESAFDSSNRKFHIRTYVLAVGAMKVYVYKPMLALFAGKEYVPPWTAESGDPNDELSGHLTNTCLQTGEREGSVHTFWALPDTVPGLPAGWKTTVFDQICTSTGEVFEAAARGMMIHFQPLSNAFEIYGLDFLVDAQGTASLLEVNAFPDFAQTGSDLSEVIRGLFENVVDTAIRPFFGLDSMNEKRSEDMVQVLDIDLGRR